MENYEIQYQKIVNGFSPSKYSTPDEQGKAIKRCSILKNVEIEYNSVNKTQNREPYI